MIDKEDWGDVTIDNLLNTKLDLKNSLNNRINLFENEKVNKL